MKTRTIVIALSAIFLGSGGVSSVAQTVYDEIDFGDDSSMFAKDGECDDPRFYDDEFGFFLDEDDEMADATDCLEAYKAGEIALGGIANSGGSYIESLVEGAAETFDTSGINFGDDSSRWALDDECDDPRFEGENMSGVLLEEDEMADASDCKTAYEAGTIRLIGEAKKSTENKSRLTNSMPIRPKATAIDFGDDSGMWANDDQCDDPRFKGEAMSGVLMIEDLEADATDCKSAFDAGLIEFNPNWEDDLDDE